MPHRIVGADDPVRPFLNTNSPQVSMLRTLICRADRGVRPYEMAEFWKAGIMTRLFEDIKGPSRYARGAFCDRDYKPGSVIDSHLSRRIVAGALQPPPRKQPGRPCFLHGVAPDRVYSNGRFHADACALTARFHPYRVGANSTYFASPRAAKLIRFVAPPLPRKTAFSAVKTKIERWLHVSEQLAI